MSARKSIRRDKLEGEFAALLKTLQPTQTLFNIAAKMFKDLWDFQSLSNTERRKRLRLDIDKLDKDISQLVDKL